MALPTIRTSRLVLRAVTPDDADALLRIFGDPELTRYWGYPTLADRAAAVDLVEDIRAGADCGELLQWAITLGEASELIGTCTRAMPPALRLVERLGFRKEGRRREHYRQHGAWQDGLMFGLLKREWRDVGPAQPYATTTTDE